MNLPDLSLVPSWVCLADFLEEEGEEGLPSRPAAEGEEEEAAFRGD